MIETTQNAFRALSDPTRRHILILLSYDEMTIGNVASHFDVTRSAIKKHLDILENGNLISVRTRGRERINKLEPSGLKVANDWMKHFSRYWDEKLSNLQNAIETEEQGKV